ncbi:ribonuclease T2 family protein [Rhizobium rhizogenes]|uniref:Ribonuclease n=1 Tax=Rhizobium rhizogenes TaxID=359 RepID=A0AA92C3W4_RHIRH|nr:ribonuclease [Rhizobium rhizogenes]PVE55025.1 ribonuclease [Rhizobium rhizogenes]PVE67578.1 ribonuclease [Agrobacterium tumefaciens]PVE77355.1 ribonuclease [Sphingomonas sp. TPD3009]
MKQYFGFIALGAMSLAAAGWVFLGQAQPASGPTTQRTGTPPAPSAQDTAKTSAAGFDFYVLSLSWSPAFCASDAGRNSRQQCGSDRKFGFVVHGLWPQNDQGYPEFCGADKNERVPDNLGRSMLDIMPSMGLIGHQWRKHGSCSGLTQKQYFDKTRDAYDRIKIPADLSTGDQSKRLSAGAIEAAFVDANPGMTKNGIAISCEGPRLEEVRICLSKTLSFRDCPEVDRQGCRSNAAEIIPIR